MTAEFVLYLGTWSKDLSRPHCFGVCPFTSIEISILDLGFHGIPEKGEAFAVTQVLGYRFHEKECNFK